MRMVLFYHSLRSDWNHGNAHFLRGVVRELCERGHDVTVYEPIDGWSRQNLIAEVGADRADAYLDVCPAMRPISHLYDPADLDLDHLLADADAVIVHEWNDHELVHRIGRHRATTGSYSLLFHDTHHRAVTQPDAMKAYDLSHYDGVLAFGRVLRDLYIERKWTRRAWVWHEAADARIFQPMPADRRTGDIVWIGNWGDGERTAELHEFLFGPIERLGLTAHIHGVRYPAEALELLSARSIRYGGWLPNYRAPEVFGGFGATVHVPRGPYVAALPGIPTIRVFEALACGIPLVSAPWHDAEELFTPGRDYLVARDGREMAEHLRTVLTDDKTARSLAEHGRRTILNRHTCAHRVDELMAVLRELAPERRTRRAPDRPATVRFRTSPDEINTSTNGLGRVADQMQWSEKEHS